MNDLDSRFHAADQIEVIDLWPDIENRQPRPTPAEAGAHRWLTLMVALVIGMGVIAAVIVTFTLRSSPPDVPITPAPAMTEGLIAFSGGSFGGPQIIVMRSDGSQQVAITSGGTIQGTSEHPFPAWEPAWSPDGSQIAFRGFWGHGDNSDLFVMNADGSNVRQLTRDANVADPAWSPDGTTIAVSGFDGIYTIDAGGGGLSRITPESTLWHNHPSWSPDGTRIAYDRSVEGIAQIFMVGLDGTDDHQISDTPSGASAPSWSPDGASIAFVGGLSGTPDIYLMNADGTGVRSLTTCDAPDCEGDFNPAWSPDGSRIVFGRDSDGGPSLYMLNPDGSGLVLIARNARDPAWQPILPLSDVSPTPSFDISAEITQTIDTGLRFPEGVVADGGGVWVATSSGTTDGGDLLRLDPSTGVVVARISMPSLPGWEFGGAGITSGVGSVWVAAFGSGQQTSTVVFRIDPETNTLAETIDVAAGSAADVWVDDTGIWVLTFADTGGSLWLYHLDQITHEVLSRTTIPANWSNTVAGAGGWIWVLGNTDDSDGAPPGTLFRIDPASGTVVDQFDPAGGESFFLSVSGDRLWFFKDDGLYALDASTGREVVGPIQLEVVGPIQIPGQCCSRLVSDGTGGVWVISATGDGPGAKGVWHVSADGIVDQHSNGNPGELADGIAAAFDPSTSSIWIVHYEDTVSRLEIKSVA